MCVKIYNSLTFGLNKQYVRIAVGLEKGGFMPWHYSAIIGSLTLKIYPLTKSQTVADKYLRLGFATDNFDDILNQLRDKNVAYTEPSVTDFAFLTVITDLDGRKIELSKKIRK